MRQALIYLIILTSFSSLVAKAEEVIAKGEEVWVVVSRQTNNRLIYRMGGKELFSIDEVMNILLEKRKQSEKFPAVRSIFEPSCTFADFSNLRGWLGKIGIVDSKFFLTDSQRRAMSEFGMIGNQLAFPATENVSPKDK